MLVSVPCVVDPDHRNIGLGTRMIQYWIEYVLRQHWHQYDIVFYMETKKPGEGKDATYNAHLTTALSVMTKFAPSVHFKHASDVTYKQDHLRRFESSVIPKIIFCFGW